MDTMNEPTQSMTDDAHAHKNKVKVIKQVLDDVENEYQYNYRFSYNGYYDNKDMMLAYANELADAINEDEISILIDMHDDNILLLIYYIEMFTLRKPVSIHALVLTMKTMLRMYKANPVLFNGIQDNMNPKKKPYYLNTDDYEDILSSFYHMYNYDDYVYMKTHLGLDERINVDYTTFMQHHEYLMSKGTANDEDDSFKTIIQDSLTDRVINLDEIITGYYENRPHDGSRNAYIQVACKHENGDSEYEYHYDDAYGNERIVNHVNGAVYIDYMMSKYEDNLDYNVLIMFHRNNLNAVYMSEITDYLIQSYAYYMFLDTVKRLACQYHNDLHGYDWGLLLHDSDTFYVDLSETTPVRIMALIYAYEHMHDVDSWSEMRINDAMSALESALQEILHDTNRSNVYDLNVDSIYYELELDYAYADASNLDVIILLMRLTTDLCLIQDFIAHDKDESSYGYTLFNEPDSWENYTSDCIINGYTVEYMIENLKIKYNNGMLNSDYGY